MAAPVRFKLILLTTFTTIRSLLPLTLRGVTLLGPFRWTIIRELLTSTLYTLIVVPILYIIFRKRLYHKIFCNFY